jgi:hypothetical protein
VRERRSGVRAEGVMLFHLAHPFLAGQNRIQVETALERLIDRRGEGNYADHTLKLTIHRDPNGLYLLKGGGPRDAVVNVSRIESRGTRVIRTIGSSLI